MQLHLVTDDEQIQVLPSIFSVQLNSFGLTIRKDLEQADAQLARLKLANVAKQIYLLQETLDTDGNRRYTLFAVPEVKGRMDIDRTYVSEGDNICWTWGEENKNSRLYQLTMSSLSRRLCVSGLGEAVGESVFSHSLLDAIEKNWK